MDKTKITGRSHSILPKFLDRQGLFENFKTRRMALTRTVAGVRIESLFPNEHFSPNDVAFGYLQNNQFVVATDFNDPSYKVEVGFIAHIIMLIALGYAKDENDLHPKVDFLVRGIVKSELEGDVIFWETPEELLASPKIFQALQECLTELKSRKLISDSNEVYGAGNGATLSLGTVAELLKANP